MNSVSKSIYILMGMGCPSSLYQHSHFYFLFRYATSVNWYFFQAALAMISPAWAAAFASPPASMALAMVAAGTSGGENRAPATTSHLRRDTSLMERKHTKYLNFYSQNFCWVRLLNKKQHTQPNYVSFG